MLRGPTEASAGHGRGLTAFGGADQKSVYTPYLMCAYAAALLLVLLGFRVIRRGMPELRGAAHLQRFILYGLAALLLFALRSHAPALLTIVAPNFLLFAGSLFLYCAAAAILEVPARLLGWIIGICIAALPPFLWFTYHRNDTVGRLEVHCSVMIAIFSMASAMLFRERRPALRYAARASAWLMTATIVLNAAWGTFGLVYRPHANFMYPDLVDAGFSYLTMILGLSNVVALAWLSLSAHRHELQVTAQTDSLTGLLNPGAFEETLRRDLQRCADAGRAMGLMLIDIDYFKKVNDAHGHLVGDDVLRRIGSALRLGIRPADVLARFGGEEFVILLRDAGLESTEEVAERLRSDIAALDDMPRGVNLTASFGVAASLPGETAGEFLLRADEALYRSKREGRNLVRVDRGGRRMAIVQTVPAR